jgi:hypothetical protein
MMKRIDKTVEQINLINYGRFERRLGAFFVSGISLDFLISEALEKGRESRCWVWKSTLAKRGNYVLPMLKIINPYTKKDENVYARRFARFLTFKAYPPVGAWLVLTCGEEKCVNPVHCIVSDAENWHADKMQAVITDPVFAAEIAAAGKKQENR